MTTRYRLDDLLIDVPRQRVERDGVLLDVGGLSFRLLEFLLEQGQRVVGFDELIERVWAPAVVNEETVTQRVRLLRQSLGDDGRNPRYLRSVRGRGYQLCVPPQRIDDASGDTTLRRSANRNPVYVGIAVVLLVGGAVAWWLQRGDEQHEQPPSPLLQRAAYYAGIGQRDDNERAIALYRQRLQEAPDDRDALVGLSRAFSAQVCLYNGEAAQIDRAQALAERVIAADPNHAAAHAAVAYSFDCRGRIDDALRGYERALSLDPSNDGARASAAYLYERRGRLADALAANLAVRDPSRARFLQIQIAANLDLLGYAAEAETRYRRSFQLYPDNVFSNLAWPSFLMRHGRNAEAQVALDEAMKRGTDHAGLHLLAAELAWARGDRDAAWREASRAAELRPQGSFARTVLWSMSPVQPPAHLLRARAESLRAGLRAGSDPFDGLDAALLLAMIDDRDAAIAALSDAVAMGYRDAAYLRATPLLANVRRSPRFDALIAAIDAAIAREREAVRARKLDVSAAP